MKRVALILAVFGSFGISFSYIQSDSLAESIQRGEVVYKTNCVSCHLKEGEGLEGTFPPLAKTDRLGDKSRLVNILYNGLRDRITVKGVQYENEMNPLNLTEQQIADVLNYIRNSWGNKDTMISLSEVKKLKKVGKSE
jgi:mono/diheme cytochrome c family protein